jgi:hypothetical protein
VIGAAAYDQKGLDAAFKPIVSETAAFRIISDWTIKQIPKNVHEGAPGTSPGELKELEVQLFGPGGLDQLQWR